MKGIFGDIFYSQVDPVPLACPEIKKLSEELDQKIANINNFKITEEQAQQKLSSRLKENLQVQVGKWKENKNSNPTLAYMEVQIESLKQLKTEAFKLATKLEWTPESFGISSVELDELIIEISLKIAESKKSERLNEAKNKKLSDQRTTN